jgi:hypothetical protein
LRLVHPREYWQTVAQADGAARGMGPARATAG